MELISNSLREAFCFQIAHERYNAAVYLYVSGFLKNMGLNNLGAHFMKQHDEEIKHSLSFFNFLVDLGVSIEIPAVDGFGTPFANISGIAKLYLEREVLTTNNINELKKLAIAEDNAVAEEFLRGMISEQQHEYSEATDFLDNATLCGDNWFNVKLWNDSLG